MTGIVHLVGAGPGDPGLLTVRAVELIGEADVVLYDRLIPPEALAHARPDAEVVYVGKEGEGPQFPQDDTHRLLLEHARAGRRVVRLKGGDPFVFGRGGEEALVLAQAGVPFEVVPGVTAGVAAPAYAGIPVTHRDVASGVAFVTGHEDPAKPDSAIDWDALARFPGTLVFYMGVRTLPRIAERLVAGGRAPDEPVAVVERGTLPGQRTLLATLDDVAERAAEEQHPRPRDHARRAPWRGCASSSPGWRRGRCTAAPSRSRAPARRRARSRRGCARSAPRSSRRRRSGSRRSTRRCRRCASTTSSASRRPNGADLLLDRLRDARELAGITVAAIGPGTARALRARGVEPDVVPDRAVAEGLVEALKDVPVERVLIARAAEGRDVLPRRAARPRRRGRRGGALRDGRRAARRRRARGGRGRRLPAVHVGLLRPPLRGRRAARSTVRACSRSARRRARSCARTAPSRPSRPTRTRPTGSSTRCSRTRGDDPPDHVPLRLRARRRVRRRRPRRDRRDLPGRAGDRPRPRRPAPGRRRRRRDAGARAAVRAGRRPPRGGRSGGRRAAPRGRAADRRAGPPAGRAGQRAAAPGAERFGGVARGGRDLGLAVAARAGLRHLPRPRPVRPGRRAARLRRAARVGRRAARAGGAGRARAAAAPRHEPGALVAHVVAIDTYGNALLDAAHDDLVESGLRLGEPVNARTGGAPRARRRGAHVLRRRRRRRCCSTRTRPARSRSPSTAATRRRCSACAPGDEVRLEGG